MRLRNLKHELKQAENLPENSPKNFLRFVNLRLRLERAERNLQRVKLACRLALAAFHAGTEISKVNVIRRSGASAWLKERDPQMLSLRIDQLRGALREAAMASHFDHVGLALTDWYIRLGRAEIRLRRAKLNAKVALAKLRSKDAALVSV